MNALNQAQRERIHQIVSNEDFEWAIINDMFSAEERKSVETAVLEDLRREGIGVDYRHGVAGRYGAETALRVKRYFLSLVNEKLAKYQTQIHKAICKDFSYCRKRRTKEFEEEGLLLSVAVADALITFATSLPLPVTSIAVYLVKNKILDRWCDCDRKKTILRRPQHGNQTA